MSGVILTHGGAVSKKSKIGDSDSISFTSLHVYSHNKLEAVPSHLSVFFLSDISKNFVNFELSTELRININHYG